MVLLLLKKRASVQAIYNPCHGSALLYVKYPPKKEEKKKRKKGKKAANRYNDSPFYLAARTGRNGHTFIYSAIFLQNKSVRPCR